MPSVAAASAWSEAFKYDSRSNLIERIDARGVKTKLSYLKGGALDPLNRLQKVEYDKSGADTTKGTIHEAADITYNYMTSGDKERIASVVANGVSTERYTYDAEGRVTNYRLEITGRTSQPLEMSYLYDTGNRLTEVRYPAAYGRTGNPRRRVSVKYDETSRLKELQVDNKIQMDQIVYNDYGQTTSIRVGGAGSSALTETYEYNGDNGLLTRQKVKRGTNSLMDLSYGYARDLWSKGTLNGITGHLTRVTNHLDRNKDRLYAYDALGRIFVAKGGKAVGGSTAKMAGVTASWHQGYWYEERGNRLTRVSTGVTADGKDVPFKGRTNWTVDGRTNRITSVNHEYDKAGNMVRGRASGGTIQRYEYDEAGRLVKVKTDAGALLEEYGYGRSRERVKKTKQDGTKVYYAWGGSSVLVEYEEGASATTLSWTKSYVYAGSRLLSTITKTGSTETTEYHHPDRLGTKLITTATTAKEQGTLPYGTALDAETTANTNQKFTSYDRSDATGLDYAVNRIYSSEQARFLQPDPIGMASVDLTDPQSLNLYTYARNNPIDFTDPMGLMTCRWWGLFYLYGDGSIAFIPGSEYLVCDEGAVQPYRPSGEKSGGGGGGIVAPPAGDDKKKCNVKNVGDMSETLRNMIRDFGIKSAEFNRLRNKAKLGFLNILGAMATAELSLTGWRVDRKRDKLTGRLKIDQERTFFTPKDLTSDVYKNLEDVVSNSGFSGNKYKEHKNIRESYRENVSKNSLQIGFSKDETFIEIDIDPNNPHKRPFPHAWDVIFRSPTDPYRVANRRYWECKPQKKGDKK